MSADGEGCRTLPSADFARYSISADSFGSTQMSAVKKAVKKVGNVRKKVEKRLGR